MHLPQTVVKFLFLLHSDRLTIVFLCIKIEEENKIIKQNKKTTQKSYQSIWALLPFSVACFRYKYIQQQQSTNNSDTNYLFFSILSRGKKARRIRGKWSVWFVPFWYIIFVFSLSPFPAPGLYFIFNRYRCTDPFSDLQIFDWRFDVTICQNNRESGMYQRIWWNLFSFPSIVWRQTFGILCLF